MTTLAELREKYPQYDSIPDGDLAYRLWNKSYKGKIPMGLYADQIELSDDGFTGMVHAAEDSGYQPTEKTFATGDIPPASKTRAAYQGMTLGAGDEIIGAIGAAGEKLMGSDKPFGELYNQYAGNERAQLAQYREAAPGGAIGSEIAGAVVTPLRGPSLARTASAPVRAATNAGASGAVYGFMSGEGGVRNRAENAVAVAIPSAIFGGAFQQGAKLTVRAGQKVADAFRQSAVRPTLETLRNTKNLAYEAVDQSGLNFTPREMLNLYSRAHRAAVDANYVPEVDRQTFAALKMIEAQRGKNPTIGQLDKLRQGLWARYNASGGSEPAIRTMIDQIDEMVEGYAPTNELMVAARAANSRYKKSELLDEAFTKAQRQTDSTGSGGNVLNKYRQAVTAILSNPDKAKWFTAAEKKQMDDFISGSWGENVLRRIGKLSPSGNGLMLALNMGAVAANPSMLAVTAAGGASKAISDAMSISKAMGLQDAVAGGIKPSSFPYIPGTGPPLAVLGDESADQIQQQYSQGQGPRR
jgi:hypothetical protein